jgi:hypothetical protein
MNQAGLAAVVVYNVVTARRVEITGIIFELLVLPVLPHLYLSIAIPQLRLSGTCRGRQRQNGADECPLFTCR